MTTVEPHGMAGTAATRVAESRTTDDRTTEDRAIDDRTTEDRAIEDRAIEARATEAGGEVSVVTVKRVSAAQRAKDAAPRWLLDSANAATRAWGVATAGLRPMPDFLIAGTKRGGTTSLWNNLLRHPQVIGMYPQIRGRKSSDFFFAADQHSLSWYRSHFPSALHRRARSRRAGDAVSGEASPYYMYGPHCPQLIRAAAPDTKIIILLRDPVARAYSHYQERRQQGVEDLDFEAALAAEEGRLAPDDARWATDPSYYSEAHDFFSYRSRGVYLPQVQRVLQAFPREQVLIMRSEDFTENYQAAFDEVSGFLGLDRHDLGLAEHHNRIPRSPMSERTRADLAAYYRPHNEALEEFLGRDFGWPG